MAERTDEQLRLRATLATIAPGTALHDGLERILRGRAQPKMSGAMKSSQTALLSRGR